jgi:hypothetical protein
MKLEKLIIVRDVQLQKDFPIGTRIPIGTEIRVWAVYGVDPWIRWDAFGPNNEYVWKADRDYVVIAHLPGNSFRYPSIILVPV